MVKIAIAGGSGRVASAIIDALNATHKHEIIILSRKGPDAEKKVPGITWVKTDYADKAQLANVFKGVHTVLSFVTTLGDTGGATQKLLIDTAIEAGVKRFAPSEWGSSTTEELPWYAEKAIIRSYLEEINKESKAIEYTLFQPGMLLDFLVPVGSSTEYFQQTELYIDFFNRRALVIEGQDGVVSLITLKDLANVVAKAIEFDGEWPIVSGIHGTTLSDRKLIEIGTKARGGKSWDVTALKEEDVRAGDIKSSWIPRYEHPNQTAEQVEFFAKMIATGCLLAGIRKSWVVSDEWNRLLPDYEFTGVEEFLLEHWGGNQFFIMANYYTPERRPARFLTLGREDEAPQVSVRSRRENPGLVMMRDIFPSSRYRDKRMDELHYEYFHRISRREDEEFKSQTDLQRWQKFMDTKNAYQEYLESLADRKGFKFNPGSTIVWMGKDDSTYHGQEFRVMYKDQEYWESLLDPTKEKDVDWSKYLLRVERKWNEYQEEHPGEEQELSRNIYWDDNLKVYRKGGAPMNMMYLYYIDDTTYADISSALERARFTQPRFSPPRFSPLRSRLPGAGSMDPFVQRLGRNAPHDDPFRSNNQADGEPPHIKNEVVEELPRGGSPSHQLKKEEDTQPPSRIQNEQARIKSEAVEAPHERRQKQESPSSPNRVEIDLTNEVEEIRIEIDLTKDEDEEVKTEEQGSIYSSSVPGIPGTPKKRRSPQMPLTPPTTKRTETRMRTPPNVKGEVDYEQKECGSPSKKAKKWN